MPARSFINLILKILGVFLIKSILEGISRTVSVLIYFPQYSSTHEAWYNLGVTLPSLVLNIFFVAMLLFKTNALIDFLRVDRGLTDQPVPVRLHRSVVLSIAVIVAGGWLIVSGFPDFIREGFYYYQERKLYTRMSRPDLSYFVLSLTRLILGVILIVLNRRVVNLVEAKRRNQGPWYWPARPPFAKKKRKKVV